MLPMHELTEDNLKQFLEMCTESYATTNPYLVQKIQTLEEFEKKTKDIVLEIMEGSRRVNEMNNTKWSSTM